MEIQITALKMVLMLSGMKMLMVILSTVVQALKITATMMTVPELAMSVVMNMVARTITMVTVVFVTQK